MERNVSRGVNLVSSVRTQQLAGMFDIPPAERDEHRWEVALPLEERDWQIGLIVGPSGSGKTVMLTDCFGTPPAWEWPAEASLIDGFDPEREITEVTGALSAVGFSSPPAWLRPYGTLSNGERFRCEVARVLVEGGDTAVIDEFTSVVDRTVAQVASAAVAKWVRHSPRKLVAASCHYDIIDWLQPDWLYDTGRATFTWRSLQPRPGIKVTVAPCDRDAWELFHRHHYLTANLARGAHCWTATVAGSPAAFASSVAFPHPRIRHARREHRTVVLPDYQGVGLGNALSELVGSAWRAVGVRYYSTTSHPAMIAHRARSPLWRMTRKPGLIRGQGATSTMTTWQQHMQRLTAGFEYVGPPATPEQVAVLLPAQNSAAGASTSRKRISTSSRAG